MTITIYGILLRSFREWRQYKDVRRPKMRKLLELSNTELLDETLRLAQGDDYEGEFTESGYCLYAFALRLLRYRLRQYGFLE